MDGDAGSSGAMGSQADHAVLEQRLWHVRITPNLGLRDASGENATAESIELGILPANGAGATSASRIWSSRGFLLEGPLDADLVREAVLRFLVDPVAETFTVAAVDGSAIHHDASKNDPHPAKILIHVLPKPGVTDPEGETARALLQDREVCVTQVRSIHTYEVLASLTADALKTLATRVLANEAVEQAFIGELPIRHLAQGSVYRLQLVSVPILGADDAELIRISREGQLALNLEEMRTIQAHYRTLQREPTDCELETVAQTWSEHCSHKTLRSAIDFDGEMIPNLLKTTIFQATRTINPDWIVSVFEDNAGVIRFDDDFDVCFKVETHNHPSAIDPYGGANTGLGGVIRDPLGTGMGARPICNSDVFCVGPLDLPAEDLPAGALHPRRILKGVVAGVRDYGNRMGIPTVNGALVVDPRYVGNPLVFCGTVGVLPVGTSEKSARPGDLIVTIGGKTGRDGIHGATFSSIELTEESESVSGGAVQIGNAITQKMMMDVVLQARDRKLYHAITDCGAGGFSSAVGEMGASLGAEVDLDQAPLKYPGLSYTEIWISEAQERMILAVPPEHWPALRDLAHSEGVEACAIGRFADHNRLILRYDGQVVGDLDMEFLHEGRPKTVRIARTPALIDATLTTPVQESYTQDLLKILGDWDVCSKEWIIRQYDHEVQGRTVVKPLVGVNHDGPGDASVILPVLGSTRGIALSCGINPHYTDYDPYAMAGCVLDEAVRNCVAVGADPDRIAVLDNFCWGNTDRPELLGALVLTAQGCHDLAVSYGTPFISGKDSLKNEYHHQGASLAIPGTLLVSAIGIMPDVGLSVTMDWKQPGNALFVLGRTKRELGGSAWTRSLGLVGGQVPHVEPSLNKALYQALHRAMRAGLIQSCHDLSEGGLAVGLAEMAFSGGFGATIELRDVPCAEDAADDGVLLFSESPGRFVIEAAPGEESALAQALGDLPYGRLGVVTAGPRLEILGLLRQPVVSASLADLKDAWQRPFRHW